MNRWACAGFDYPSENMDRGKVVRDRDVFEAFEEFGHYLDVDGDGIPYRTLPGLNGTDTIPEQVTTQWVFTPRNLDYLQLMTRLRNKIDSARINCLHQF